MLSILKSINKIFIYTCDIKAMKKKKILVGKLVLYHTLSEHDSHDTISQMAYQTTTWTVQQFKPIIKCTILLGRRNVVLNSVLLCQVKSSLSLCQTFTHTITHLGLVKDFKSFVFSVSSQFSKNVYIVALKFREVKKLKSICNKI